MAANFTLGPELKAEYGVTLTFLFPGVTVAQTSVSDPEAKLVSPVDGLIVRWRLSKQPAADPYALRVLRPAAGGAYTGAGASTTVIGSTTAAQTFATHLPIKAGDAIGLDLPKSNPSTFGASVAGLKLPYFSPLLADGATSAPSNFVSSLELGFNAEVKPAPRVVLVGPPSGPTAGGTKVTIAGSDFRGVSGVRFGSVPASSFEVVSEAEITATAPAGAAGAVDVSVATDAGTSPALAGDRFTYTTPPAAPAPAPPAPPPSTCVVPKLVGKNLKAARKALAGSDCTLGKVKGEKGKAAKVVKQAPKPGTSRAAGSAVSVKLG